MNQSLAIKPTQISNQDIKNSFNTQLFVTEATDFGFFFGRLSAFFMLLCTLPLLILVALAIKITSSGPVFYQQVRVGRFGKTFSIKKFRTMITDAEKHTGAVLATAGDTRITRIGKLLRATHLDELPQLWNVVKGDMGFIGPRPERPVFVDKFVTTIPRYHERHLVIPGITGLAQILLPYDALPEEKLVLDLTYLNSRLDWKLKSRIFTATAVKMIRSLVPFLVRFKGSQDYRTLLESMIYSMREGSTSVSTVVR
jgi:lipopolysaccharide/colanic/teichoic acid biosynthesis glycosyltransferase